MTKLHIHIIKMGGTIEFVDPAYDAMNKRLMQLDTTIESYLSRVIQPHFNFSYETVATKDSRELNESDREKLATAIRNTPHTNIVVTHGTFTLKQTAEYLESQQITDKKIVLTGSMIPITGFTTSDAGFNLGYVIGSFPTIENGIYVSMNGGIFHSSEISKNEELLRFE